MRTTRQPTLGQLPLRIASLPFPPCQTKAPRGLQNGGPPYKVSLENAASCTGENKDAKPRLGPTTVFLHGVSALHGDYSQLDFEHRAFPRALQGSHSSKEPASISIRAG